MNDQPPHGVHGSRRNGRGPAHLPIDQRTVGPRHVDDVLSVVRQTAADLLSSSPQPPSSLSVRVGDVAVEMGWAGTAPAASAPEAASPAPPVAAPVVSPVVSADAGGPTLDAATVGTFYRSPSPGAPPFVSEGDEVAQGQQIAIIEAMKLMLPVEAEHAGRITEVLVGDGQGVEFGQPLFRLAAAETDLAA
jgi:acetyl-CoA carboxylase biotin carboxyl carrier protein